VAVTTDLRRRVWIADSGTASVHVFDPVSGTYREIKRAGERPLVQPSGIASDAQGRVFVADAATGAVFMFDENGDDHAVVKPGAGVVVAPGAIAISEDGRTVYVADPPRNVIVELNREGEVNGAISLPPELSDPAAICVVHNQIYALGAREHRIGAFTPAGRQLGDLRWDDIALPAAFTFDAVRGRFLAANPRWMIVQIFEEEGRNLGAFGQAGDGVDQMQRVDALYVDRDGQVYVVDSRHGKVLVFAEAVHP
jgi:DNA-binding beta-propeller fold protein YncE